MGSEQGKAVKPNNQQSNKQIKSCNHLDEPHSDRAASPSKIIKPKSKSKFNVLQRLIISLCKLHQNNSSTNLSIDDLQQQMNLEEYELIEIMEYLKKHKYFLDQTILGKGGNGFVLKGIDGQNGKIAIKVLKCETEDQYVQNQVEYENQKMAKSKYVVQVKDLLHYHNQKSSLQFLIMERCLTDLKNFMKDKQQNNIWMSKKYIYQTSLQLVLGLKAIHNRNILHLDIKPANVLLGLDLKWKFTDLGVSKNVNDEIDHTVNLKGITACYSSPEQYQLYQFQSNKKITKHCDIYSLGVVFMELTGVDVRKKWVIKQKIRHKPYDKYLNPEFQEYNDVIVKNMLQYNANSRISLEEIEIVLKNLINSENTENGNKPEQSESTQDGTGGTHKSVNFIEPQSPVKLQKPTHQKSFSVIDDKKRSSISEEKQQKVEPQLSIQQQASQLYQMSKSGAQSPVKKIIIPIDKIQQYNYSVRPIESPDNSPLKKRTVKIVHRHSKMGSQTPMSGSNYAFGDAQMPGINVSPQKQRIISSNNLDQQEYQSKSFVNQSRRAASLHQNQFQDILPPISSQSRLSQVNNNNNGYANLPSPISYVKRSSLYQSSNQNGMTNSQMIAQSQVMGHSSSQSPVNLNKKNSSKSFSQKVIMPLKLTSNNFQQTKNQFDFVVSN